MRVVIITWEYPPRVIGVIANYVQRLALNLAESGMNISIVTFHNHLRGVERQGDKINVFRVGNPVDPHQNILTWNLTLAVELERTVSDIYYSVHGNIDLIDAQEWLSIVPSVVMKKVFNIPFVYSIDSLEEHRSHHMNSPLNISIKNLEHLGADESYKVLVKSEWMKTEVKKILKVPDQKIVLILPTSSTWSTEIKEFYQSVIRL